MPRHATSKRTYRSSSAERAYRSGTVTHTIDITQSPAFTVRQRATAAALRNSLVLSAVAAMVWLFDLAEVVRG